MNLEEKYLAGEDHHGKKTEEEAIGLKNGIQIPSKTF